MDNLTDREELRIRLQRDGGPIFEVSEIKRVRPEVFPFRHDIGGVFGHIRNGVVRRGMAIIHITAATPGEGVSTVAREIIHAAAALPWCCPLLIDRNPGPNDQGKWFRTELPLLFDGYGGCRQLNVTAIEADDIAFHAARVPPHVIIDNNSKNPHSLPALKRLDSVAAEKEAGHAIVDVPKLPTYADQRTPGDLLRMAYNLVVVDCPSVLQSSQFQSSHFMPLSEEFADVVLVIRAEQTRLSVIDAAKRHLTTTGCNVSGVVLNGWRRRIPKLIERLL